MNLTSLCHRCVLAVLASLLAPETSRAATYYWDTNGPTLGFGTAAGTWGSDSFWNSASDGGAGMFTSTTVLGDILYFGTDTDALASGTITVSGTQFAGSALYFGKTSGAITLSGGTIDFSSPGRSVIQTTSSGGTAAATQTINSNLTKSSPGDNTIQFGNQTTVGENYIVNGIISGTTNVDNRTVNNGAYVAYNGLNTYTGNFSLITGQANANTIADSGAASSLGAGTTITVAGGGGQNPTLWYTGTIAASTNRTVNLNGGFVRIVSQDAPLTFAGPITGTSGSFTSNLLLTGDAGSGSNFNSISGVIGGNVKVEVSSFAPIGGSAEAGRWRLSGANTYTGSTTLNAGVLQADRADVAGVSGALGNGGDITFAGGTLQYTANSAGTDYSTRIKSSTSAMIFDTNGQNVTFGTALATSNNGGLTKNGGGLLDIKMGTSYTGTTTIDGGTLRFTNVADLAGVSTTNFLINNGSTLEFQSSIGGNNRTVLNNKNFTFDANGGGTINFNGGNHLFQGGNTHNFVTTGGAKNTISSTNGGFMNMQGAGNPAFTVADGTDEWDLELSATFNNGQITKNGAGTMAITGAHSGNYAITINGGILEIAGTARLNGGNFTASIANDGVLKYSSTQTQTLSGNITGSGEVRQEGSGILVLSGSNSYTGATRIKAGKISVSSDANLGTAPISFSASHLDLDGGTLLATGTFTLDNNRGVRVTLNGGAFEVTAGEALLIGSGNAIFLQGPLSKTGAGTLLVNSSSSGTGPVTVSAGTLGGTGTISGSTTVASGAFLTGGTSGGVGMLSFGANLTTNPGSTWLIDLVRDVNGSSDRIDASSGLLDLGNADLNLGFTGVFTAGHTYTIATFNTLSGTFDGLSDGAIISNYQIRYGTLTPGAITLTAVPEPGTLGLLGLSLGGLFWRRHRKSVRSR